MSIHSIERRCTPCTTYQFQVLKRTRTIPKSSDHQSLRREWKKTMAFFTSTPSGNGAPAWIQHVFNRDLAALRSSIDAAVTEYESVRRKVHIVIFFYFISFN